MDAIIETSSASVVIQDEDSEFKWYLQLRVVFCSFIVIQRRSRDIKGGGEGGKDGRRRGEGEREEERDILGYSGHSSICTRTLTLEMCLHWTSA